MLAGRAAVAQLAQCSHSCSFEEVKQNHLFHQDGFQSRGQRANVLGKGWQLDGLQDNIWGHPAQCAAVQASHQSAQLCQALPIQDLQGN